jgi:RimJ/RimL family protein N-acetyltransferase
VRLAGERVVLLPCPPDVATGVVSGVGLASALAAAGLTAARGWPHQDTADALRPLAEQAADGTFLVALDGTVIGECGWLGGPDGSGEAEIGYGLAGPSRGGRLGTEAVALLAAWVERQPGVRRISASVHVGNEASRRLLERLGFALESAPPPYVRYVREVPAWTSRATSG